MTIKVHFDGEVFIPDEPVNLPTGAAHVEHPDSPALKNYVTAAELLDSGVIGIWADRKDIKDSVQFAQELRERTAAGDLAVLLLDTDVIVDILRRYTPAVQWLERTRQEQLFISGFSSMEVLAGCLDKREQDAIQRQLFSRFRVVWLPEPQCERALQMYSAIHLSNWELSMH